MRRSKIIGLKVLWNEQIQKKGWGVSYRIGRGPATYAPSHAYSACDESQPGRAGGPCNGLLPCHTLGESEGHPRRRARRNMYIHTFLFQWHPSVTAEMKDRAAREIRGLQGQIPGLLETRYGANVSPRSQGFPPGGVMELQDKAVLDAFSPHPTNQKLVDWLMPLLKVAAE